MGMRTYFKQLKMMQNRINTSKLNKSKSDGKKKVKAAEKSTGLKTVPEKKETP